MKYPHLACAFAIGLVISRPATGATEFEQRAAVEEATQRSFLASDFRQLERISSKYRKKQSRTSSGLWNLTLFYAGFEVAVENLTEGQDPDTSFAAVEERTRKWIEEFPDSPTAHIAHSLVLMERAWAHRGGGYASTVKPESWAPFDQYVAEARAYLEDHKTVASVDPRWYETMMVVARTQNWDRREFDALLKEALEREPLFYQSYFSAMAYLSPRWHGNIREIENFAQEAVNWTRKKEGDGMYARIYWYASQSEFKNDLFNNSLVEWPQMKQGFEDVVSRYPDAWNLNNYARFACLAGDKPKTRELLNRIDSSVVPEAWAPVPLNRQCTEWAFRP